MCCLLNYALSKSIDTHTHSHALAKKKKKTRRTHLFSSCISENVNHALMPLLLPSVSFFFSVFRSVSWALIYVWLRSQHVRLDLASFFYSFSILPSPPHAFFREGKGTFFWNTISFYGLNKPPEAKREWETEREMERGREVGHRRASLNKEALCSPPTVSDWQSALQHATAACAPKHC